VDDLERQLSGAERAVLEEAGSCAFVGDAQTVQHGLEQFIAQTGADELIIASQIYDPVARIRSYEITADIGIEQRLSSPHHSAPQPASSHA
jgi:alkanesulfonate monooxygenase SsuD/methylene tetrahydromethanopterin reductase-like flavin-dependent oxidoreductase (luciferase family)